ncbi:gephyrin-like molybdotransferase Glp [Paenibacillus sp. UMB4589-SE434]|uniref:molybdopterin molybdotransferase MoeA n=1 Tax=Paenibacillus sp. UMB4589-SE434 TaxID=3046314 RepID=UPI00254FAB55|nr:gephyrin-like molybdotransferase Glp [Paenibacillus sp. UMB4589-SE434]MDK8182464.1 molybdopterin molybdotransferase MoeA [Paenibacillus sp. UMB4589-SE434]
MEPSQTDYQARFQRNPLTIYEAQHALIHRINSESVEVIPLEQAYMRRTAQTIRANMPVPHFQRSMMDGFAVKAADTCNVKQDMAAQLQVVGSIACGDVWKRPVETGEAVRIMTGAQLPEGADAVIKLEATSDLQRRTTGQSVDDRILVHQAVSIGENVNAIGTEMVEGQLLIEKGSRLEAGEMALLAMFGYEYVHVYTKPRVAIISTGHELLSISADIEAGKIRNSNSYMLLAQIQEAGGTPYLLPHVADDLHQLTQLLQEALQEYDAVITTGGVSVGDHDILYDFTQNWDGELLFNKVKMRPGSPSTVGFLHGKPLFALSGNPSACFVGCEMFVRPALLRMQGVSEPYRTPLRGKLEESYHVSDTFVRFVRGVMRTQEDGAVVVRPVGVDMSSATISIMKANCLFVVLPSPSGLKKGAIVDIVPLRLFN